MAKPGRRRTLAQIDKDAQTLAYHLQAKTHREIMVLQGYKSPGTVTHAIRRAVADRQKDAFDQVDQFAIAIARYMRLIAEHEAAAAKTYYVVSNTGKLVLGPDGEPLTDEAPRRQARVEIRHLQEEINKLQGNYAPAKARLEIVPEDVVDREIAQLAQEIAEAGKNKPVPGE